MQSVWGKLVELYTQSKVVLRQTVLSKKHRTIIHLDGISALMQRGCRDISNLNLAQLLSE